MTWVYRFFGGKSVFFAFAFTSAGVTGFFMHLLTGAQFISLATLMQGWVAVRSMGDDYHERNKPRDSAPQG